VDTLQSKNHPEINSQNMYNHKQAQEILNKCHQIFRVDQNNIFFMINYRGEEPQDIYKELNALKILKRCIDRARQFINQRKKILIKEVNGNGRKIIPLNQDDITLAEFRELYGDIIKKLLKSQEFIFIEYPPEDEDSVYLNEIDQIDEEFGERIKCLCVALPAKKSPKKSHNPAYTNRFSDSINDRASNSNKNLDNEIFYSENRYKTEQSIQYFDKGEEYESYYTSEFEREVEEEEKDEKNNKFLDDYTLDRTEKSLINKGFESYKVFFFFKINNH